MRKWRLRSSVLIPVVMAALLLFAVGCGSGGFFGADKTPVPKLSPAPTFDPKIITVGVDSRPSSMLFHAINHYIPRNRFRLKPVPVEDPNERWMMMAAGDLDLAFSTLPEFVLGAARHKPGQLTAITSTSSGCDGIVVKNNVTHINQMVGRRISAVPGSAAHYFLIKVLDSRAKSTAEVEFIPAPFNSTVYNYFTSGEYVDGAALSGPELFETEGKYNTLVSTRHFSSIAEVLVAGDFAVKHRPHDVQTVVNGYYQLVDFIRKNPGLAKKLISTRSGKSIAQVEKMMQCVRMKTLEEARAPSKESLISGMKKIQQIWSIEGLPNAEGRIDYDGIINSKFMDRAVVKPSSPLFDPTPLPTLEPIVTPATPSPTFGAPSPTPAATAAPTITPTATLTEDPGVPGGDPSTP